jgi:hypothetical protein
MLASCWAVDSASEATVEYVLGNRPVRCRTKMAAVDTETTQESIHLRLQLDGHAGLQLLAGEDILAM